MPCTCPARPAATAEGRRRPRRPPGRRRSSSRGASPRSACWAWSTAWPTSRPTASAIAGLSSNGLLSTISVVTAAVLVAAALRGSRVASTVMLVIGVLFLRLRAGQPRRPGDRAEPPGLLADQRLLLPRAPGWCCSLLGAYGRVSGNLPQDSPYARPGTTTPRTTPRPSYPSTPAEFAAEKAMRGRRARRRRAHRATADQQRRVAAMAAGPGPGRATRRGCPSTAAAQLSAGPRRRRE